MPFNSADEINTEKKYKDLFKTEAKKLNGDPVEFFFCPDYPIEGKKTPVLVMGKVKKPVIKDLREKGSSVAWGQCSLNAKKEIKLEIEKGKIQRDALNKAVKGSGFDCEVVDSIEVAPQKSKEEHDDEQEKVRSQRGLYMLKDAFETAKGELTDDDRKTLRGKIYAIDDLIAKSEFKKADQAVKAVAKEFSDAKANRIKGLKEETERREKELEDKIKDIERSIKTQQQTLDTAERKVAKIVKTISDMEDANKKSGQKLKQVQARQQRIDEFKEELDTEKENLKRVKEEITPKIEELKQLKADAPKALAIAMVNIKKKLEGLETHVGTAEEFRARLSKLVQEQAEAIEWQEDQVDSGEGHGTGRHGAQTGVDRQARRAATDRGVTPDQEGNESGTTQILRDKDTDETTTERAKWLGVTIEYETNATGKKRKIKDKKKLTGAILKEAKERTGGGGGKSSIWATPVLEKEAVGRALKFANQMKSWKKWNDGSDHDFTSLGVMIGKPASAPGWGYAVERGMGPQISESDADDILTDFEEGRININQMLNRFNVKLVEKPDGGGVKMVPNARIIFRRDAPGGDWKLVTHYPDNDLSSSDLGFETDKNTRPSTVLMKDGGTEKSFKTKMSI